MQIRVTAAMWIAKAYDSKKNEEETIFFRIFMISAGPPYMPPSNAWLVVLKPRRH